MPGRALRIARTVFLWLFTALVALVMFLAGTGKMAGVNPWPEFFVAWGYPVWFRFFVGTLQLAGAITVEPSLRVIEPTKLEGFMSD